jgi:hypothetical protein
LDFKNAFYETQIYIPGEKNLLQAAVLFLILQTSTYRFIYTSLTEKRGEEILHRIPGCRIRFGIISDWHMKFLAVGSGRRIGKSMRGAVIADKSIGGADRVHLFFKGRYIFWRHELIGIPMTDEDLCPQ